MKEIRMKYPKEQPGTEMEDKIKQLYQDEFGGGIVIMDLSVLDRGLSAETLDRMSVLTAQKAAGSMEKFQQKLELLSVCAADGETGDPAEPLDVFDPSYRIVKEEYADYCRVFCDIDRLLAVEGTKPVLAAIDGKSGSGKSTLGELIQEVYECSLFHMDDFFLQPHQRTEERFAEIGGNVDYERFYDQVLIPVLAGKNFSYRRYDCCSGKLAETIDVTASRLNIIEGVYSQHPYFGEIYDLKYFLTVSDEEQKERILKRNGEFMLERFLNEWIPLENAYFEKFEIGKTVIKK